MEVTGRENVHILRATGCEKVTSDGIPMLGKKLFEEMYGALHFIFISESQMSGASPQDEESRKPMLYAVGHSLGGIILRWALGHMYQQGIFDKVTPMAYMSLCTPHFGV